MLILALLFFGASSLPFNAGVATCEVKEVMIDGERYVLIKATPFSSMLRSHLHIDYSYEKGEATIAFVGTVLGPGVEPMPDAYLFNVENLNYKTNQDTLDYYVVQDGRRTLVGFITDIGKPGPLD